MKNTKTFLHQYISRGAIFSSLLFLTFSCQGQTPTKQQDNLNILTTEVKSSESQALSPAAYDDRDIVTSGLLDKRGNLWFGTTREGVFKYDGDSFTNFSTLDGLCDDEVWSILEDTDGHLWLGTANGLCRYDGNSFTHIPIPWDGEHDLWGEACNPNIVTTLLQDAQGDIWLGTCGGGAYRYDGETFTSFLADKSQLQSDGRHHNLIKSVLEDKNGNIWFTSLTHGGVSRYDGTTITDFGPADGLHDDMIFASVLDRDGNPWFGSIQTEHSGLYRFDARSGRFISYGKEDGLCDNFIMSLFADENGTLILGAGSKLCTFDGRDFSPFIEAENTDFNDIRFFVKDTAGDLWFGGRAGKLWRWDGERLMNFTDKRN